MPARVAALTLRPGHGAVPGPAIGRAGEGVTRPAEGRLPAMAAAAPRTDHVSMPATVTLSGRVVRLEPLAYEHGPALLAAATEDRTSYGFLAVPADPAGMSAYVEAAVAERAAGTAVPFAVRLRATGRIVGATRLTRLEYWLSELAADAAEPTEEPDPLRVPDAAEIGGSWLAASAQGTGANTEAKLLLLSHAFDSWGVHRVGFRSDARNTRSCRAIEKLGAHRDGVLRAHSPGVDGVVRDTVFCSILREEWPQVRHRLQTRLATGPLVPAGAWSRP